MKISTKAKTELGRPTKVCCKRARFAALLRTAGSLGISSNGVSVTLTTDNKDVIDFASEYVLDKYGEHGDVVKGKHLSVTLDGKEVKRLLVENGVLGSDGAGLRQETGIAEYIIKGSCCLREFIKGAFLGCGFLSSDCKHIEFAFSSEDIAVEFSRLISEIVPNCGMVVRNEKHIVYYSKKSSVIDVLAYMGASISALRVMDSIALGDVKRKSTARSNCDMANIDRQIEASEEQIKNINLIDEKIGLEELSEKLATVAHLRKAYPSASITELADMTGMSKSGLNHRLSRLNEIAKSLKVTGGDA